MLRTALDSTRHSRHQLLAATWRSISHFSAERTQLDVRRQESPEHGPTSPLVPLSLLPPLLSLANWLLGWRVFSLSLSRVRLHLADVPLDRCRARTRHSTALSESLRHYRARVAPLPNRGRWVSKRPFATIREANHTRKKRSPSYHAAYRRPLHLLKIRQELPCVPENSNMRSTIVEDARMLAETPERGRWRRNHATNFFTRVRQWQVLTNDVRRRYRLKPMGT